MSTPNFRTQANFPLYVFDESLTRDEVIEVLEANDEEITESNINRWYGYLIEDRAQFFIDDIQPELDKINNSLNFFKIILRDGYYTGIQLYIESTTEYNYADYDNDETRYEFDLCLSQFKRKYAAEANKIGRHMKKLAVDYGMIHLNCIGIFSNGEAIYEQVA